MTAQRVVTGHGVGGAERRENFTSSVGIGSRGAPASLPGPTRDMLQECMCGRANLILVRKEAFSSQLLQGTVENTVKIALPISVGLTQ